MRQGFDREQKIIRRDYLEFVRTKPCVGCGKRPVEASHLKAVGWRQAKRIDFTAVPMCRPCHGDWHAWGREKFERLYLVDVWKEALFLMIEFYMKSFEKNQESRRE